MGWAFLAILIAVAGYVSMCGDKIERLALAALLFGYVGTFVFHHLVGERDWLSPSVGIWLCDVITLVFLFDLAHRSRRSWLFVLAALHLLSVLTPLVAWISNAVASRALGITQGLWSYPQLLILALAVIIRRRNAARPSSEI